MSAKIEPQPRAGMTWSLLGVGFVLWAGALIFWMESRPPYQLRIQLMEIAPLFFWMIFAALITLVVWNAGSIRALLTRYPRRHIILAAAAGLLAWCCASQLAPRTHRIFYDEDIYQGIGLSMAQTGKAAMMHDSRWSYGRLQSFRNEYNKQPNGWPFLLNLAYRAFGVSEPVSSHVTHVLFALAAGLVFLCGALLFESSRAGALAALIYALIPENTLWFSTVAVEPSAAWASLLAMAAMLFYFKNRTTSALFLAAVAWSLAVQFRPEVIMLTGVAAVMFYIDGWEEFRRPVLYAALGVFLVLISGHLVHLYVMRGESWGSSGDKLSLDYVLHNLKTNTIYYLNGKRFPVLFSVLALAGLALPGMIKSRLYTGAWFLVTWGIFLFFYAGSYEYGADVRFALMSLAPLALLAGRGLDRGLALLDKRWGGLKDRWLAPALVGLILQLFLYSPLMRAEGEEAWPSRRDHAAAEEFSKLIPQDGIVLTHNPTMFQMWGKNAAQASLVKEQPAYFEKVIRHTFDRNIFFHWNYWCEVPVPVQRSFCEHILASQPSELVAEQKVRGYRFALYRLKPAKDGPSSSPKASSPQSAKP